MLIIVLPYDCVILLLYILKRNGNIGPYKNYFKIVHNYIIPNTQQVITTEVPTNKWMEQNCVVSTVEHHLAPYGNEW